MNEDEKVLEIEGVLYEKAIAGEQKAIEFWLKHRVPKRWGKLNEEQSWGVLNYELLADMIKRPEIYNKGE